MRGNNQKLKLLYLARIMMENTDEDHPLTMPEILSLLGKEEIDAQRKSIYADFEALKDFGIEIIKETRGRKTCYYVGKREFEVAELKFLVDAIQASRFMTEKKTNELIRKLGKLLSKDEAKLLKRQVFVSGRVKSMNETIYYSVDMIHTAINTNRQITFKYFSWNEKGEQKLHHGGKVYHVSPWALFFADENYYLVAYDEDEDKLKHYRVDKMLNMEVSDEVRKGSEKYKDTDKARYTKQCFGMYGGKEERVILLCRNRMANVIIDRFGIKTPRLRVDEEHFEARVDVQVSDQFLGWIIALGPDVRVVGPKTCVDRMKAIAGRLSEEYLDRGEE